MDAEQIVECKRMIAEALNSCSNMLVLADADGFPFYMDFDEATVFNAIIVLNSIISNYAVKHGHIKTPEEAEEIGTKFSVVIKEMFGVDTMKLANETLKQ